MARVQSFNLNVVYVDHLFNLVIVDDVASPGVHYLESVQEILAGVFREMAPILSHQKSGLQTLLGQVLLNMHLLERLHVAV